MPQWISWALGLPDRLPFINEENLGRGSWQAFERQVARLLMHDGFSGIRLVGQTRDQGADVLAHKADKRWVLQVKHWKRRVGLDVVDRTLEAMSTYRGHVPVIVALSGFDDRVRVAQQDLMARDWPLQLWDRRVLLDRAGQLVDEPPEQLEPREYQEEVIRSVLRQLTEGSSKNAMVVMATGLGKTFVAAEVIRRLRAQRPLKTLAVAHTNEIVYQLERAFWRTLRPTQNTLIWNGYEQPTQADLASSELTFACLPTLSDHLERGGVLEDYDFVLIDEAHHVGAAMYDRVLEGTGAGGDHGPLLLGLTATPWRADEVDLANYFGQPVASVDMVTGLRKGFLSTVDYRMYTDNIDWEGLASLEGSRFSPAQINRSIFIDEWDDAVVKELRGAWQEQENPRAIVFCGTVDHAITMRDRINALGFCHAAAIYSRIPGGRAMEAYERSKLLSDFHDGIVNVVCSVDIFNEGVDVPDVNIVVFQRVTHSRRIFVQQLGRGLRIAPGKEKLIVLDFVSDVRRFAAGLSLKDGLGSAATAADPVHVALPHKVQFRRAGGDDPATEDFLREWLDDIASIEEAGEDASVLRYPPVHTVDG